MSAPVWPFSWPSPSTWGDTDIDQAAALLPWREVRHYELSTDHGFGTVRQLGRFWYAHLIAAGYSRPIGPPYSSRAEAMAAVEQAFTELAADS